MDATKDYTAWSVRWNKAETKKRRIDGVHGKVYDGVKVDEVYGIVYEMIALSALWRPLRQLFPRRSEGGVCRFRFPSIVNFIVNSDATNSIVNFAVNYFEWLRSGACLTSDL